MLHYEESPEKPQYNTVIPISRQPSPHPPFCLNTLPPAPPSFRAKIFTHPISIFMKGGGGSNYEITGKVIATHVKGAIKRSVGFLQYKFPPGTRLLVNL